MGASHVGILTSWVASLADTFTLVRAQTQIQCVLQPCKIRLLRLFFRSRAPVQEQGKLCSASNESGTNCLLAYVKKTDNSQVMKNNIIS